MSGYLDEYGVAEARRARIIKRAVLAALLLAVAAGALYFQFRNYREERQIKTFLAHLEKHEFKQAYALWGCTDEKPCPDYSFEKFLEDWGPESGHTNIQAVRITETQSCETGIIQALTFGEDDEVWLWVARSDKMLSYAPPWHMCSPHIPVGSLKNP